MAYDPGPLACLRRPSRGRRSPKGVVELVIGSVSPPAADLPGSTTANMMEAIPVIIN